jgi:hypothetical protein
MVRGLIGLGWLPVLGLVVGCGGSTFTSEQDPSGGSGGAAGSGGAGTSGASGAGTGGSAGGGGTGGVAGYGTGGTGAAGTGGSGGGRGGSGAAGTGGTGGSGGGAAGTGGTGGSGGSAAAGGTGGIGGAGTGGAGAAGTGGSGRNTGDCDESSQCGELGECVELAPGGFRVCVQPVEEATECHPDGTFGDECCDTSECEEGVCLESPLVPLCGGMPPVPVNVCATDECTSTEQCAAENSVCVPAGVWVRKVGTCVTGSCVFDSDCTEYGGGTCQPVQGPCCFAPSGLYCVYPGGCRTSADCDDPSHTCVIREGQGVCTPDLIACPA